jgi:hypothetical protein
MVNLATPSKLLTILSVLTITSCTSLKQDIVNSDTPVASFSAQNQIDQTDNSLAWINKQGIVEYNVHWGWKCSKEGDKSFVWFEQKGFVKPNKSINVSEENCQ